MPPSVMDALNRVHSAPRKMDKPGPVLATARAGVAKTADTAALDVGGKKKKKKTGDKATDDAEAKLNESDDLSATNKKLAQELKEMRALLAAAAEKTKRLGDDSDSEQGSNRDRRGRRNKKQRSATDEKQGTLHRSDIYRAMSVSVETGKHAAMSPGATEILKFAVVTHLNDYDYLSYNFVEGYDIRRARPCRATSRDILAIRESKNR